MNANKSADIIYLTVYLGARAHIETQGGINKKSNKSEKNSNTVKNEQYGFGVENFTHFMVKFCELYVRCWSSFCE